MTHNPQQQQQQNSNNKEALVSFVRSPEEDDDEEELFILPPPLDVIEEVVVPSSSSSSAAAAAAAAALSQQQQHEKTSSSSSSSSSSAGHHHHHHHQAIIPALPPLEDCSLGVDTFSSGGILVPFNGQRSTTTTASSASRSSEAAAAGGGGGGAAATTNNTVVVVTGGGGGGSLEPEEEEEEQHHLVVQPSSTTSQTISPPPPPPQNNINNINLLNHQQQQHQHQSNNDHHLQNFVAQQHLLQQQQQHAPPPPPPVAGGGGGGGTNEPMFQPLTNLYVSNLSPGTDNDLLFSWFRAFGPLVSACVMVDVQSGQSRGYGFVQFEKEDHGESALNNLNGRVVHIPHDNQTIVLRVQRSMYHKGLSTAPTRTIFLRNIPSSYDASRLLPILSQYGEVERIQLFNIFEAPTLIKACVDYKSKMGALAAVNALHRKLLDPTCNVALAARFADVKRRLSETLSTSVTSVTSSGSAGGGAVAGQHHQQHHHQQQQHHQQHQQQNQNFLRLSCGGEPFHSSGGLSLSTTSAALATSGQFDLSFATTSAGDSRRHSGVTPNNDHSRRASYEKVQHGGVSSLASSSYPISAETSNVTNLSLQSGGGGGGGGSAFAAHAPSHQQPQQQNHPTKF